jgi:hypothetical protein
MLFTRLCFVLRKMILMSVGRNLCSFCLLMLLLFLMCHSIYMGDLGIFSQGLRTIADILMGAEKCSDSPPDDQKQIRVTIFGLNCFINSAAGLLKSNEISEEQHAMLLSAIFSRHPSLELVFALFRSPFYHRLVTENKERAKIGKSIIFHCIRILTPYMSTALFQRQQRGHRRWEESSSSPHCTNKRRHDRRWGARESLDPSDVLRPLARVLGNRPGTPAIAEVSTTAANGLGMVMQGSLFEVYLMKGGSGKSCFVSSCICWVKPIV